MEEKIKEWFQKCFINAWKYHFDMTAHKSLYGGQTFDEWWDANKEVILKQIKEL